jgi:hypothetical protein
MSMSKIVIGFSKPRKRMPFSWLIRKAYGTPYSHVFVSWRSDSLERDLVYQASGIAVNFIGLKAFDEINETIDRFEFDVDDILKKQMMQFAIDNAGKHYSLRAVFGLAVVRIAEWCGKTIKNPFKDGTHTYVCSELVAGIIKNFLDKDLPKDVEDMTPKDVYDFMVALRAPEAV